MSTLRLCSCSIEGAGQAFRPMLPFAKPIGGPITMDEGSLPNSPNRTLRLLVSDNDPVNQRMLEALLYGVGHSVTLAANGRETIDVVMHDDFDAVLMEIQMPLMDGIQAAQCIRALPPPKRDMPIIATNAVRSALERYRIAEMDGYLSKPLSVAALFRMLNEMTYEGRPKRSAAWA
jgi:two-component system, sensor histidine kinase